MFGSDWHAEQWRFHWERREKRWGWHRSQAKWHEKRTEFYKFQMAVISYYMPKLVENIYKTSPLLQRLLRNANSQL